MTFTGEVGGWDFATLRFFPDKTFAEHASLSLFRIFSFILLPSGNTKSAPLLPQGNGVVVISLFIIIKLNPARVNINLKVKVTVYEEQAQFGENKDLYLS